MVKKQIIWSLRAKNERREILEFWFKKNKSSVYSKKLNMLFMEAISLISVYPAIGKLTEDKNARIKIVRNYLIIYEECNSQIVILTIFDSRQDPHNLNI